MMKLILFLIFHCLAPTKEEEEIRDKKFFDLVECSAQFIDDTLKLDFPIIPIKPIARTCLLIMNRKKLPLDVMIIIFEFCDFEYIFFIKNQGYYNILKRIMTMKILPGIFNIIKIIKSSEHHLMPSTTFSTCLRFLHHYYYQFADEEYNEFLKNPQQEAFNSIALEVFYERFLCGEDETTTTISKDLKKLKTKLAAVVTKKDEVSVIELQSQLNQCTNSESKDHHCFDFSDYLMNYCILALQLQYIELGDIAIYKAIEKLLMIRQAENRLRSFADDVMNPSDSGEFTFNPIFIRLRIKMTNEENGEIFFNRFCELYNPDNKEVFRQLLSSTKKCEKNVFITQKKQESIKTVAPIFQKKQESIKTVAAIFQRFVTLIVKFTKCTISLIRQFFKIICPQNLDS